MLRSRDMALKAVSRGGPDMKHALNITMLTYWFIANSIMTIGFGLFLAAICLFPTWAPSVHMLLVNETSAPILPYVIFSLIVTSLVLISFYVDSRWR